MTCEWEEEAEPCVSRAAVRLVYVEEPDGVRTRDERRRDVEVCRRHGERARVVLRDIESEAPAGDTVGTLPLFAPPHLAGVLRSADDS